MKATNMVKLLKDKHDHFIKHQFEWKAIVSPALKAYWFELVKKNHCSFSFQEAANDEESELNKKKLPISEHVFNSQAAQILYNELESRINTEIHIGDWLLIDQDRIDAFGKVTEDEQWIHTDPLKAESDSPFKTTIAHGFLTLSMISRLTDSVDPEKNLFPTAKMIVNIGLNSVRFPYPVRAGDRIRSRSKLLKVTPIKKGLEIERKISVEIENVRRPGCVIVSVIQLHF